MNTGKMVSRLAIGASLVVVGLALAAPALAQTQAKAITCPDVSLPTVNQNQWFAIDADAGTCTAAQEGQNPRNGFLMYSYSYQYQNFASVESRGTFSRNGANDPAGTFKVICQQDSCTHEHRFTDGAGQVQTLKLNQSFSGKSVTNISASIASLGTCEQISGVYGPEATIIAGADGKLNVQVGAQRPLAYGTCTGAGNVSVSFPDDTTLTGTFDGTQVIWANGSTWLKYSPVNPYPEPASPIATAASSTACMGASGVYRYGSIVVGEDGKTVNVYIGDDRPLAYGTCTDAGALTVTYPDDSTLTGTMSSTTISWSNNTSWTKK